MEGLRGLGAVNRSVRRNSTDGDRISRGMAACDATFEVAGGGRRCWIQGWRRIVVQLEPNFYSIRSRTPTDLVLYRHCFLPDPGPTETEVAHVGPLRWEIGRAHV